MPLSAPAVESPARAAYRAGMEGAPRPFSSLDAVGEVLTAAELETLTALIVKLTRRLPGNLGPKLYLDVLTQVENLGDRVHEHIKRTLPASFDQKNAADACDHLSGAFMAAEKLLPSLDDEEAAMERDVSRFLGSLEIVGG